jgi:hypothetical protein
MSSLETQKDDILEPHHGDKSPKHKETITPFKLK